jgi:Fic family protein
MAQLVDWYNSEAYKQHPIERATKVNADFVGMHPFIDSNGCTSRLLINLKLLKADYPPYIITTVENRLVYYEALDQWMTYGKTEAFIQLVSEDLIRLY